MRIARSSVRRALPAIVVAIGMLVGGPAAVLADDFEEALARVDQALKKNPKRVAHLALESCRNRRNFAARLYYAGQGARAERSLKYCFKLLEIPEERPVPVEAAKAAARSMEEIQERAAAEVERALALTPNIENGLKIYRECAVCHMPEGWGLSAGSVPQVAGQHRKVVIKQLADTRAGNRDNVLMVPYASVEAIGGPQAVADVAGYIDTLEISIENGKGPGNDLELGERLYQENCARCHGETGEGDDETYMPRIQAQHYNYLVRQFEWIRDGKRRNADPAMVAQIEGFEDREMRAVLDYVSRLRPPEEFQAPAGWRNPDFAEVERGGPSPR
jgi:cytochrome c553